MRLLFGIVALLALASCAGRSPGAASRPRVVVRATLPSAPSPAVPGCEPTLVAAGPFFRWSAPRVRATGARPPLVADREVVGRVAGAEVSRARYAFGAPVVALASHGEGVRVVTSDGGVFELRTLDARPRRVADLGGGAHAISLAPAGALMVRDDPIYGTLLSVDERGRAAPVPGLPPSTVKDAVFFDAHRAVVLLAGGVAGVWRDGVFRRAQTERPVRALVLEPDGVLGELAPAAPRTDFTRPPTSERVRLARGALELAPGAGDRDTAHCESLPFGPECALAVCDGRRLFLECGGAERLPIEGPPGSESMFVRPIPLGDGRRFVLEAGAIYLAERDGDAFSFTQIDVPRDWSREIVAASGGWLHLPSTRDHHAPGETDVLFHLDTRELVDLGAFRGRERSRLLPDGTVIVLRLDDGAPALSLGAVPGPLSSVALPELALDADFLDANRGVALGRDASEIFFTCDGGAHWTRAPLDGGERVLTQLPTDLGDHPSPGLVICGDERCVLRFAVALALDFDPRRASAAPRPLAPLRAAPAREPGSPVVRLHCRRSRAPRRSRPAAPPRFVSGSAGCAVEWSGADERGAYRASSSRFPCELIPDEPGRVLRGVAREGVLLASRRTGLGPWWIAAGGGVTALGQRGPVRGVAIPGGLVFEQAQMQHGPVRAAVLGASGVLAELSVDFFPRDASVGWVGGAAPGLVALVDVYQASARGFRFPMRSDALPEALPRITFDLCDADRPVGPLARMPSPPIHFDGQDSPYAYAAELDLAAPATCVRRVFTSRETLTVDGPRLVGRGIVCARSDRSAPASD